MRLILWHDWSLIHWWSEGWLQACHCHAGILIVTLKMEFTKLMSSMKEEMGKVKHGRRGTWITSEDGNSKEKSQPMPTLAGRTGQDGWDHKAKQLVLRPWAQHSLCFQDFYFGLALDWLNGPTDHYWWGIFHCSSIWEWVSFCATRPCRNISGAILGFTWKGTSDLNWNANVDLP